MVVVAEIVTGLLTSIIYDGLKRPLRGFGEAMTRRRALNRTLSGVPHPETDAVHVNAALSDVARILGNDHNSFSEEVAQFLREIEQSAIPDALKQFALCGHDPEDAFSAFELIYNSHEKLPFACRPLFNAIYTAIKLRIDQTVGDRVLFEAFKAQNESLAAKISALSACLRGAGGIENALDAKTYDDLRQKIARGIEAANRHVNVETTQGTRRVSIKKLVIAARLSQVADKGKIPHAHRDGQQDRAPNTSYLTFRRSFSRSVILGDPGGGKSTLTQLLCFDLAHQILLSSSNPNVRGFDSRDMRLPLRVVLRTLERRQQHDPSYQIFDYLVDEIRIHCDNDTELARKFLQQTLIIGQAALLFDGLDEVLDVEARRTMVTLIEQFSAVYSTCAALVTSRIVGYNDAPLNDEYSIYTLARFNPDEVKKFCEQLLRAINNEKVAVAKKKAAEFISQTDSTAGDLRENPLLLGLMVYIYNARGEVPNNRPEIYRECSLLMFEKWDQRRDIRFEFPQDFDLLDLFGFLAKQIFGQADTEDGVDEAWLTERLRSYFNLWYEDKARSVGAAKILVEFITGRAWVMCEIGPGVFKFTHRTFLEYFFAKRVEEEAGSVSTLISGYLMPKIMEAQWDVVSHLALQIATFRSGPKSVQALESLLQVGQEIRMTPDQEQNFLSFFSRALEYLLVPEVKLQSAITHIFSRCVFIGANFSLGVTEIFHEVLESTIRRQKIAKSLIPDLARPILLGPDNNERSYLTSLLGVRFSGYRANRPNSRFNRIIWEAFSSIRGEVKSIIWQRAQTDLMQARYFIYIYSENVVELTDIHGITLLMYPYSNLIPFEISHLGFFVVHAAARHGLGRRLPSFTDMEFEKDEAVRILTKLSDELLLHWQEGRIAEIVPAPPEQIRFAIVSEFLHHFADLSRLRHSPSQKEILARSVFSLLVMSGADKSRDDFEHALSLSGKRRARQQVDVSPLGLGDNSFAEALRMIESRIGRAILDRPNDDTG